MGRIDEPLSYTCLSELSLGLSATNATLTKRASPSGPVTNISSVAVNSQVAVDQPSATVSSTDASITTS